MKLLTIKTALAGTYHTIALLAVTLPLLPLPSDAQSKNPKIKEQKHIIAYDERALSNSEEPLRISPRSPDAASQEFAARHEYQNQGITNKAAREIAGEMLVTLSVRNNRKLGSKPILDLTREQSLAQMRQALRSLVKRSLRVEIKNPKQSTLLFRHSVEGLLDNKTHLGSNSKVAKNLSLAARLRKNKNLATITFLVKTKGKEIIAPFTRRIKRASPRSNIAIKENSYSVIIAETNKMYPIISDPNDPKYPEQWGLKKAVTGDSAWEKSTGNGVTIAIIDTGVDYNHRDLRDQIAINPGETPNNGLDDDANGYIDDFRGYDFVSSNSPSCSKNEDCSGPDADPMDVNGHGTHCAGIAAAKVNNLQSIAGACPDCKILPIRAGFNTSNNSGMLDLADILEALRYAVVRRAHVVSMSFGGPLSSEHQQVLFDQGTAQGTIFVAAAGNSGSADKSYPAAQQNVISVAATEASAPGSERLAFFSQRGAWVSIAAPGQSIISTIPGNDTKSLSGTSMAAPLAAGIIGLVKAKNPNYDVSQIEWILTQQAKRSPFLSNTLNPGSGEIHALSALNFQGAPPSGLGLTAELISTSLTENGLAIHGTASGAQFSSYDLELRSTDGSDWSTVANSTAAKTAELLGNIPRSSLRGTSVDLRLTVKGRTSTTRRVKYLRVDLARVYQIRASNPIRVRSFLKESSESESIAKRGTVVTFGIQMLGTNPEVRWRKSAPAGEWSTAGIAHSTTARGSVSWDTNVVSEDGIYEVHLSDELNDGASSFVHLYANASTPKQLGDPQSIRERTFAGVLATGRNLNSLNHLMGHVRNSSTRVAESSNDLTVQSIQADPLPGFPQKSAAESTVSYFPTRAELDGNPSTHEYVAATYSALSNPGAGKTSYIVRGYSSSGQILFSTPIIESQAGRLIWVGISQNPIATGDLNGDGLSEIFYRQTDALVALDHQGKELWREPLTMASAILLDIVRSNSFIGVGKFGIDAIPGVVVLDFTAGTDQAPGETIVKVLGFDGKLLSGWPIRLPSTHVEASIAIADFNGDKRSDISLITKNYFNFDFKPGQVKALVLNGINGTILAESVIAQSRVREKVSMIVGDRDHNGKAELFINYPRTTAGSQSLKVVGLEYNGLQGLRESFSATFTGSVVQPLLLTNLDDDPADLELLVSTIQFTNGISGYTEDVIHQIEVVDSSGKPQTSNFLHRLPFMSIAASVNEVSAQERSLVLSIGLPYWNSQAGQWSYLINGFSTLSLPRLKGPDLFQGCGAWESLNGNSKNNNSLLSCGMEADTPRPSPTATNTMRATSTSSPSPSPSPSPKPSLTPTPVRTSAATSTPSNRATATFTFTSTSIPTNTATLVPTQTPTHTKVPTAPPTPSATQGQQLRIFISSEKYSGDLGGLAGADKKCTDLASASRHPGNYRAILSDSGIDAKNRFPQTATIVDISGKIIASSVSDLFLGLGFAPNLTEKGQYLTDPEDAATWTGCHRYGERISFAPEGYCNNWTVSNPNLGTVFGNPTVSYRWLRAHDNQMTKACSLTGASGLRIYCLEQPNQGVFPTLTPTVTPTPTVTFTPTYTNTPRPSEGVAYIFMSSQTFSGALGGLTGADATCHQMGSILSKPLKWKAVLSTSTVDVRDRFSGFNGPVFDTRERLITSNLSQLWQGFLNLPVRITETGSDNWYNNIWSGSLAGGVKDTRPWAGTCSNWMLDSQQLRAETGAAGYSNMGWLSYWAINNSSRGMACNERKPIVCLGIPLASDQPEQTATPSPTLTNTAVATETPTSTAVPSTATPTFTNTIKPTASPSLTATHTVTPQFTPTITATATATITPTNTPAITKHVPPTPTSSSLSTPLPTVEPSIDPTATPAITTGTGVLRIFKTSTGVPGNFHGVAEAKAICIAHAQRAGLGGDDWDAIISEDGNSARDRLRINGPIYQLNNSIVAHNAADLWDGTIQTPIQITETGSSGDYTKILIWSGTRPDGSADTRASGSNCENWSSTFGSSETGRVDAVDYRWLSLYAPFEQAANSCSNTASFYCLEQRLTPVTRSAVRAETFFSLKERSLRAERLSRFELRNQGVFFNIRYPGPGVPAEYFNITVRRKGSRQSVIVPASRPELFLGSKDIFSGSAKVVISVSGFYKGMIVSNFNSRLRRSDLRKSKSNKVEARIPTPKLLGKDNKPPILTLLAQQKDGSYAATEDGELFRLSNDGKKLERLLDYHEIAPAVGKPIEVRSIGNELFVLTDKGYLMGTGQEALRADLLTSRP